MPLHLAQHKSYHPYKQANKDKVRKDQALAAEQEQEERRTSFARRDEARLEALRSGRSGSSSSNQRIKDRLECLPPHQSHREQTSPHSKRRKPHSGHSLLRPEDELKPWYTTIQLRNGSESRKSEDQRLEEAYKDSTVKSSNDPLKAMESFLAKRKAAQQVHTSLSPYLHTEDHSNQYEPEAVKAAKSHRRRQRPDLTDDSLREHTTRLEAKKHRSEESYPKPRRPRDHHNHQDGERHHISYQRSRGESRSDARRDQSHRSR